MTRIRSSWLILAATITLAMAGATPSAAQVPPRFYWKTLVGTHAVPVIGMAMNGNANPIDPAHGVLADADVEATLAIAGYGHTFAIFDRAALAAVLLPMGRIAGDVTLFGRTFDDEASGFGDPMIEFTINLLGPKAIRNIPDLLRYEPGFSIDLLFDLAFPIGEYDDDQPLNLGQNRWYGRIGAPIVWQLGPWVPGRRTTLEGVPSLWFYSDNDDFLGRKLSTDPKFQLEGHLTRDLMERLWASADVNWMYGGKSTLDGVKGDDLNSVAVGFTLGIQIIDNLQLTASYTATVNDNDDDDLQMDGFRLSIVFGWHPLIEGMKRLQGEP